MGRKKVVEVAETSEAKKVSKAYGEFAAPLVPPPRKEKLSQEAIDEIKNDIKKANCQHDYAILETVKNSYDSGNTSALRTWTRIDRFYCKKCLDNKELMKSEMRKQKPEWY